MRTYNKPPKVVDHKLPDGFSENFLRSLTSTLDCVDLGFKSHYLEQNLMSKFCDPKVTSPAVRADSAIKKWLSTEHGNGKTNSNLFWHNARETDLGWTNFVDLFEVIRHTISRVLGPLRYPDVLFSMSHTNGASTRVNRSKTAALHKLEGTAHVSSSALKHWLAVASGTERLSRQNLELREASTLFTVPKNSVIDRVACKEPEINMLMQRSIGSHIRRRLRFVGIDLNDQSINQRLAASGVRDGLATIDLSSASDSISRQLVEMLLPFEWFSLLDDLRVKFTIMKNGHVRHLSMFSSMGNGFTFELESLIFYAITRAVCKMNKVHGRVSVYGDDIIAPCVIVPRLIRVLHLCGFKTNKSKTFWTGDFRESCGKHYYRGFDVSPFFVRRKVSTLPDLINLLNKFGQWSCGDVGFIEDPTLLQFHMRWSMSVPDYLWGGTDFAENSCLVTGHPPRYRLSERKVSNRPLWLDTEALTHWFMVSENSKHAFTVESQKILSTKASRVSKGWTTSIKPWFISESGLI